MTQTKNKAGRDWEIEKAAGSDRALASLIAHHEAAADRLAGGGGW